MAKQTCLEVRGIEERHNELVRNDYVRNDEYSQTHKDALSDGDPLGKGSGYGGHTHSVPDCTKPTNLMSYSNFDTRSENIGGLYDIMGRDGTGQTNGRNFLKTISVYNSENEYGRNYVDTLANRIDGQIMI